MAQAVTRWTLIVEARARARASLCGICGGQTGSGTGFSPANIIPPLFHTHLTPPHDGCDSSGQSAH
jgi:hypothetical protein